MFSQLLQFIFTRFLCKDEFSGGKTMYTLWDLSDADFSTRKKAVVDGHEVLNMGGRAGGSSVLILWY